jgi:hypothetical protein
MGCTGSGTVKGGRVGKRRAHILLKAGRKRGSERMEEFSFQ